MFWAVSFRAQAVFPALCSHLTGIFSIKLNIPGSNMGLDLGMSDMRKRARSLGNSQSHERNWLTGELPNP